MRFRSSRRAVRLALVALAASVAPIALIPSLAQEFKEQVWVAPDQPDTPDVTRGFGLFRRPAPVTPPPAPSFDAAATPLENHPLMLRSFDTANVLPEGALMLYVGTMQTDPNQGTGTGNQVYFGGGRYAFTDRLTLGLDYWTYEDPPVNPIAGGYPHIIMEPAAFTGRYQFIDNGTFSVSAQASLEAFRRLRSPLYGGGTKGLLIGSFKLPISYSLSPQLQFHVTPGVTYFPDTVQGMPFYGTLATLGAGVSYKPSQRLAFYGSVEMSFGDGGNTISSDGTYKNTPVWTVGGRYNLTPRLALDAFLTNGVGMTPTTSILTHFPEGDMLLAGAKLIYTPGAKWRQTYRGRPEPLSPRQMDLQKDGFTLGTAHVLEPLSFAPSVWLGTDDNSGGAISAGIDRDFGIDLIFETYSDNKTANPSLVPTTQLRYMFGPKLRFMDQNNGDAFSLSARLLFGRQFQSGAAGVGVFYLEGLANYDVNDRLTLTASPKFAAFGNTEAMGLGFGANYEVFDGLQLIAEATAVGLDADKATWAVGARYSPGSFPFTVDISASNAVGRYGIGTMVAQDDPRYTLGLSSRFSLR